SYVTIGVMRHQDGSDAFRFVLSSIKAPGGRSLAKAIRDVDLIPGFLDPLALVRLLREQRNGHGKANHDRRRVLHAALQLPYLSHTLRSGELSWGGSPATSSRAPHPAMIVRGE